MRRLRALLAVMIIGWGFSAAAASSSRPIVAVFDVEAKALTDELRSELSDYLAARLASSGQYEVVPRDELRQRLAKQKRASYRSCYEETCQIEIGQELAAEEVASIQLIQAGDLCILTVRIFDLRKATSSNAAAVEGRCGRSGLFDSMRKASTKLAPTEDAFGGSVGPLGFGIRPLAPKLRRTLLVPWTVTGVVVASVEDASEAGRAGLEVGQVVTEAIISHGESRVRLVGSELDGVDEIALKGRQGLALSVWQAGALRSLLLTSGAGRPRRGLGFSWTPATPERLRDLGLPLERGGLLVASTEPAGQAAKAGLRAGQLIVGGFVKHGGRMKRLELIDLVPYLLDPPKTELILRVFSRKRETRVFMRPIPEPPAGGLDATPKRRAFRKPETRPFIKPIAKPAAGGGGSTSKRRANENPPGR